MPRSPLLQRLNTRRRSLCLGSGYSLAAFLPCLAGTSYRLFTRIVALPSWGMTPAYRYYAIPTVYQGEVEPDTDDPSQKGSTVFAKIYWQCLQSIYLEKVNRFRIEKESAFWFKAPHSDVSRPVPYSRHKGQALETSGREWQETLIQGVTVSPDHTNSVFYSRYLKALTTQVLKMSLTPGVKQSLSQQDSGRLKIVPSCIYFPMQREKSVSIEKLTSDKRTRTALERVSQIKHLRLEGIQRFALDNIKCFRIEKESAFWFKDRHSDVSRPTPYSWHKGQVPEASGRIGQETLIQGVTLPYTRVPYFIAAL